MKYWDSLEAHVTTHSGMSGPPLTGNAIENTITKVPRPKPPEPQNHFSYCTSSNWTLNNLCLFYLMKKCTLKEDNLKNDLNKSLKQSEKAQHLGILFIYLL